MIREEINNFIKMQINTNQLNIDKEQKNLLKILPIFHMNNDYQENYVFFIKLKKR